MDSTREAIFRTRQTALDSAKHADQVSQSSRLLRVAGAMLVNNGLTILLQIAMVPALIWAWGASLYGEWLILYTIPGYLSMTDFGIIATSNNRIEAHCAHRYFVAANRTYFNSIIVLAGLIALMLGVGTALWLAFGRHFSLLFETLQGPEVLRIAALLFIDAMVNLVLNHHSALYRSLDRFNWTVNWQAAGRVVPIIGLIIAAVAGATLTVAALTMLVLRLLLISLMVVDLRRRIYWLRWRWLRSNQREIGKLLRGALGFTTLQLSNMIYLHVTTLMVAAITTPVGVATFSTMRTFTRMIPQFVAVVGRSHWSEIAKVNARSEHATVLAMQGNVLRQTLGLSVLAIVGYLAFGKIFYLAWTGGTLPFNRVLFLALVANAVMIACYYSLEVFLLATNRVGGYAQIFLAATLLQIGAGYLLVNKIGVAAFPVTGALAAVGIFIYLLWKIRDVREKVLPSAEPLQ